MVSLAVIDRLSIVRPTYHRSPKKHPNFKEFSQIKKVKKPVKPEELPTAPESTNGKETEVERPQEAPKLQTLHKALTDWTARANTRAERKRARIATARLEQLSGSIRPPAGELASSGPSGPYEIETDQQFRERLNHRLRNFEKGI
jgi:hypothetical protein